jgi:hypothetical protein
MLYRERGMTSFRRLALGIPPRPMQDWAFGYLQPNTILLIFTRIKKLLYFWAIFLMQFVPHCPIFYFLADPWLVSLRCTSENKATAAH